MKTDMVVSCPKCGAENTLTMEYRGAGGIDGFLKMIMPDIKQYSFTGETRCVCGEIVNAVLSVGNGHKQVIGNRVKRHE
jgi:predicted nucleic-acid-binding Zn-ribbon protein